MGNKLSKSGTRRAIVKLLKNKGPMDSRELPGLLKINKDKTEEALEGLMGKKKIFFNQKDQVDLIKTPWLCWFYWIRERFFTIKTAI